MRKIPGCGNWRIRYRIIEEGIEILRAVTCDRQAVLPGAIEGLPVVKIAGHALSADPWDTSEVVKAIEVELTDGRPLAPDVEWGNRGIETMRLPEEIREVGDYAFLNCRSMRRLELSDRAIIWQRACFMNCRSLREIVLRREHMEEDRRNVAYFVGDTTGELDITIRAKGDAGEPEPAGREVPGYGDLPGGSEARLIFPDYLELYTENNEARQFDYTIEGAGYPYRHVFRDRQLSWRDYDGLWPSYLGRESDKARAARMAWYRVSRPVGLAPEHRPAYEAYVREHFLELAEHLLGSEGNRPGSAEHDSAELARLVQIAAPDRELLSAAAAVARRLGRTDCLAILMEEEHRQAPAPAGRRKTYDL